MNVFSSYIHNLLFSTQQSSSATETHRTVSQLIRYVGYGTLLSNK